MDRHGADVPQGSSAPGNHPDFAPVPGSGQRFWAIAGVATVVALIALTGITQRKDLYDAAHVLRSAQPGWIALAATFTAIGLISLNLTYLCALRAAGVEASYRTLLPTTLRGHLLNLVAKSNGLAGLVAFSRHGKERAQNHGSYVAGYLLSGISQQIGFAAVALATFVLLLAQGDLRPTDLIAGVVFFIYVSINVLLIVSAIRSRSAIRAIYQRLHRLIPGDRKAEPDHTNADELHDAAQLLRTNPGVAIVTLIPAIGIDLAYVGLLFAALRAVGAPASLSVVFVAFSLSTLFGIIGFLPSGIGFVEVSALAVLVDSGVPPARAGAAIALFRLGQLWIPILAGIAVSGSRLPNSWWRPVRWSAAAVTAVIGVLGLIEAAVAPPGRRLDLDETVVGIVRSAHFGRAVVAIALLSCVPGLWRGKRWATFASVGLGFTLLVSSEIYRPDMSVALLVLVPVVSLGRGGFGVESDAFAFAANLRRYVAAQLGIFAYGLGGLYFMEGSFGQVRLLDAAQDAVKLLFLLPADATVLTVRGVHLVESVRLLSLVATGVFLFSTLVPLVRKPTGRARELEREKAKTRVERWGAGRLAHFTLWDDKEWTLAEEGLVSYHRAGKVALALGGPIGSRLGKADVLERHLDYCDAVGLIPAFHQVSDSDGPMLKEAGFRLLHIGAEAIVDTESFTLEGSHWKSIRNTLRKLDSTGHRVEELRQPLSDEIVTELKHVSDAWRSSGGHRERTFTLGQFSADYLRSTRVLAVLGPDDSVHAFVNIVPPYHDTNGTFDLMRRRPDSANGVMDLLFVSMINNCKSEGLEGLNMGMAPLAMVPDGDLIDRGLQQLRERGDHWFNFAGLEKYKQKWEPRWEPRYVAYRGPSDLPAVLRAVQTAGELPEDTSRGERLRGLAKRFPATAAIGTLIIYLMAVTAVDPSLHTRMITGFGISFRSFGNLEWWRLISSPLLQARPGFVWGNLLLVLTVLPASELMFGSRRTTLAFWIGHVLTIGPVILVMRILGGLGFSTAVELAYVRDAGSSAGLWALVGFLVHRLPNVRHRAFVLSLVVLTHFVLWIVRGELPDVQHAIATLIGFGLAAWWSRKDATEHHNDAPT